MIREVLDVMRDLAHEGMTMIVVTHEMGCARRLIAFVDEGDRGGRAEAFFEGAKRRSWQDFVDKILRH